MFYNFAPSGLCWFHSFHSQVSQALQHVLYNFAPSGLVGFIRSIHRRHRPYSLCCIISPRWGFLVSFVFFTDLQPVLYNFAPLGLVGVPFATGVFYMPCKGMIL